MLDRLLHFGQKYAKALIDSGVDCITLGDHAFDQKDMMSGISSEPRIIRPINLAKTAPGKGAQYFDLPDGRKVLVIQVLGQVFMKRVFEDPFNNRQNFKSKSYWKASRCYYFRYSCRGYI